MVSSIIREHLGWLVVWGGGVGFLLGLTFKVFYFFYNFKILLKSTLNNTSNTLHQKGKIH